MRLIDNIEHVGIWKIISVVQFFVLLVILFPILTPPSSISSNKSATLSQFSNYIFALRMFHGEYGYYPSFLDGRERISLADRPDGEHFYEALSGRDWNGEAIAKYGNDRAIAFHSFSESELHYPANLDYPLITDRFNNPNIIICVDHDADGYVEVIEGDIPKLIRADIVIYTIPLEGEERIATYE